jgi:hypothetical protein
MGLRVFLVRKVTDYLSKEHRPLEFETCTVREHVDNTIRWKGSVDIYLERN